MSRYFKKWPSCLQGFAALALLLGLTGCGDSRESQAVVHFDEVSISYQPLEGIGPEKGMLRRDPSDIIKVDDLYYIWYTKVLKKAPGYPEGYNGTIWYATSPDSFVWTEQGEAIGRGEADAFDAFGVFTPNVIYAPTTGKYYLYYTGVTTGGSKEWSFESFTGNIGAVVADHPNGGPNGWQRVNGGEPVLSRRADVAAVFDGWHIDDTVVFYRDETYWLYYKGHSKDDQLEAMGLPHRSTPMGLATSDRPDGGFERVSLSSEQDFLVQPGHELLLWPYGDGILALPTGHSRPDHVDDFRVLYSSDGMNFSAVSPLVHNSQQITSRDNRALRAPAMYRPDLTQNDEDLGDQPWGICMSAYRRDSGLQRFVINLVPHDNESSSNAASIDQ